MTRAQAVAAVTRCADIVAAGDGWASEGIAPTTVGQDWPVGPGRERRISWWRERFNAEEVPRLNARIEALKAFFQGEPKL